MKLNVYEKKQIVKTYEVDEYDLLWGVVEDVADAIKVDELKTGSNEEIMKLAVNLVVTGKDTVNFLLKDIFEGLTDEEIRKLRVSEIAKVLVDVVKFTIKQLNIGVNQKN